MTHIYHYTFSRYKQNTWELTSDLTGVTDVNLFQKINGILTAALTRGLTVSDEWGSNTQNVCCHGNLLGLALFSVGGVWCLWTSYRQQRQPCLWGFLSWVPPCQSAKEYKLLLTRLGSPQKETRATSLLSSSLTPPVCKQSHYLCITVSSG